MDGFETRKLVIAAAAIALLAGCNGGSATTPASSAPHSTPRVVATPALTETATPSLAAAPAPTPTRTVAPSASSAAERDSLPSEFVGTWEMVPREKWCAGKDCGIALVIEACALGERCGSLIEAQQPACEFPLTFAEAGLGPILPSVSAPAPAPRVPCPGCVTLDASLAAGPGCHGHFGSGQLLRFDSAGRLQWSTGDGWSAELERAP